MVQKGSYLDILNNLSLENGKLIHIFRKQKIKKVGSLLLIVGYKKKKLMTEKNKLYYSLLLNLRKNSKRLDGSYLLSEKSNVLILNDQKLIQFSLDLLVPVPIELRKNKMVSSYLVFNSIFI